MDNDNVLVQGESVIASYKGPELEAEWTDYEIVHVLAIVGRLSSHYGMKTMQKDSQQIGRYEKALSESAKHAANTKPISSGNPYGMPRFRADTLLITNFRVIMVTGSGVAFEIILDGDYLKKIYGEKNQRAQAALQKMYETSKNEGLSSPTTSPEAKEAREESRVTLNALTNVLVGIKKIKSFSGAEWLILTVRSYKPRAALKNQKSAPLSIMKEFGVYGGRHIDRPWRLKLKDIDAENSLDKIMGALEQKTENLKTIKL